MDGQNAIVLYNKEVSVVPYEGFEFAKKHKPRPKVDLDQETERTWKLLMGKGGSEGLEGTDKEKEKWWEEEREVFRGRANSFIARMHLVQGTIHHTFRSKHQISRSLQFVDTFISRNSHLLLSILFTETSSFQIMSIKYHKLKSIRRLMNNFIMMPNKSWD